MSHWFIEVAQDNPFSNQGSHHVEENPFGQAEKLSLENPGREVCVTAFARTRRVYVDGEIVQEFPELSHFYSGGMSVEEQEAWANGTPLPKEEWELTEQS